MKPVPEGYTLLKSRRPGDCLDHMGPFYVSRDGLDLSLGLWLDLHHCNPFDEAHGGLMPLMADMAFGSLLLGEPRLLHSVATLQLDARYLRSPRRGDWLTAWATVSQQGHRLAFTRAEFRVGDERVGEASGVFKIFSEADASRRRAKVATP